MPRENTEQTKITKQTKKPKAESYKLSASFVCSVIFVCSVFSLSVLADELHLKDGRVIDAEQVWQIGETVWYRQGNVVASVPKVDVVRITKPKPATTTEPKTEPKDPSTAPSSTAPSRDNVITRNVTRIVLKDGTQIDADSVWEDSERVGYSLGKMQAFIDRKEVKNVIRAVSVSEQAIPSDIQFRFTTGHRGLDRLIVYSSSKYQLDPLLIYLVMREESGFNHRAVSRVGARGLMQLMPATARRLGVRNIHDPLENVDAGSRYLRSLLEMFNGDVNLALAAYNAGEDAVLRYGRRIPPYRETMNYVWRINTAYRRAVAK